MADYTFPVVGEGVDYPTVVREWTPPEPEPQPVTIPVSVVTATDGALDPAAQPNQVAPLDHASSQRIAEHADAPFTPTVAPLNNIPTPTPSSNVSPTTRFEYSRALQDGEVHGAQDFAERYAGAAYAVAQDETPDKAPSADDHAAITNAASALAGALPAHEDLIDNSISLSHQVFGGATPNSVALIKQNLLDAWVETGVSPDDLVRTAFSQPDLAARLATPPPTPWQQSPQFPTPEELADKNAPILDEPEMTMMGQGQGRISPVHSLIAQTLTQYEKDSLTEAMQAGEQKAPKTSAEFAQAATDPQALEKAIGFALGMGGGEGPTGGAMKKAAAPVLQAHEQIVRTGLGHYFPTIKAPNAEFARGNIRKNTGQARNAKDITADMIEEFRPITNKMLPEDRQFQKDMSAYAHARTAAKEAWVADGNHPSAYQDPAGLQPPPLSQLQILRDHIEQRPGGGRVAEGTPLHDLASVLSQMLQSVKGEIERHFDIASFVDNYMPHQYEDQSAFAKAFGSARRGDASALNRRSIPTLYDAMIRGLKLRHSDPLDSIFHYVQGMVDYLASERILREGEAAGQIHWGRTAPFDGWVKLRDVERRPEWADRTAEMQAQLRIGSDYDRDIEMANKITGPGKQQAISGAGQDVATIPPSRTQAQLGHNKPPEPLQIEGPVEPTEAQQKAGYNRRRVPDKEFAWAHPSYATVYNNWSGAGFMKWERGGPIYQKLQAATNAATALKLGLTGAHAFNIAHAVIDSGLGNAFGEISRGELARGLKDMGMTLTLLPRLVADYRAGGKFQDIYLGKSGDLTPVQAQMRRVYIEAGGRPMGRGAEMAIGQAKNLFQAWKNGGLTEIMHDRFGGEGNPIARATIGGAKLLGDISHTLSAPLFDNAIPKLKLAAWANEMEAYLRKNPKASDSEQLAFARMTMDAKDDIYGELNSENVFLPRYVKQVANMSLLSQSWWYGTMRAFGRGASDLLHLQNTARARWLLAAPITYGLIAMAYQRFMTGTNPQSMTDLVAPPTGGSLPSGAPERAKWLSPFKEFMDIYSGIFAAGHSSDPIAAIKNIALGYAGGKGNPLVKAMADYLLSEPGQNWHQQILRDVMPMLAGDQSPQRGTNIGAIQHWLGFSPAARSIADPAALGDILDKQAKKQTLTEQWRAYYQDRNSENPVGLPRPPNTLPPRMPGGGAIPKPGALPSGRGTPRERKR